MSDLSRRLLLKQATSGAMVAAFMPLCAFAQERRFEPQPGAWRTFELTTTVNVLNPKGATRVWLPVPSIDSEYQRSLESSWVGNATTARFQSDEKYGAKMLYAEFAESVTAPTIQLTSRVQTRNRATDWDQKHKHARGSGGSESVDAADRVDAHRRHRAQDGASTRRKARSPTSTRCASSTTGSWPTPIASRRSVAAAPATSRPCSRRATWEANAATSMRCSWACLARWVCRRATCTASGWCPRLSAIASSAATRPT